MTPEMLEAFPQVKLPATQAEVDKTQQRCPTALWNGMLRPLVGMAMRGVIWYHVKGGWVSSKNTTQIEGNVDNLKKGEVFKKGEKVMWFCRNCGHVVVGLEAPEVCPVCFHDRGYFQQKAENY